MRMRAALLVLLFAQLAVAAVDLDPKQVGSSLVSADLDWHIRFGSQVPDEVTFITFGFLNYPAQRVESFTASQFQTARSDAFGNQLLAFTFRPSGAEEVIRMEARVRADAESSREPVSGDLSRYLGSSPFVSLDSEFRSKALEVTFGARNDFEKSVRLTEWVHNYVHYDGPGYGASIENATYVYQKRAGTCDEYSHLLIALLRSAGIPARFSAGLVYTGEVWGLHAWVEAAMNGQWVPLDPTYGEAGRIDATHVVLSHGVDMDDIKSEIRARSLRISGFGLEGTEITPVPRIQFLEARNFTPHRFSLSVETPKGKVGEGSLEKVTVLVRGAQEEVGIPLSLIAPPELKILDEQDRLLYLTPGEERRVEWRVLVPRDLQAGFIYRFPLHVQSLGVQADALLEAQKGGARTVGEGFSIKELRSEVHGGELVVLAVVRNAGNAAIEGSATLSLAGRNETQSLSLLVGGEVRLEFRVSVPASAEKVDGELLLTGAQASLRQPLTIMFPTPTPQPAPAATTLELPGGPVRITAPSEEQLLFYSVFMLVLLLLVGTALTRRRER